MKLKTKATTSLLLLTLLFVTNAQACVTGEFAWKWGLQGKAWDLLVGEPCGNMTERELESFWQEGFDLGLD